MPGALRADKGASTAARRLEGHHVIPGDEEYARLEHQALFLFERGLTSDEMQDWNRQLWLLERLAGKDPSRLDPHLRDRLHCELERATMEQLRATGLVEEWLAAWDALAEPEAAEAIEAPARSLERARG